MAAARFASLTSFDSGDRKWHQHWVDQAGAMRDFAGGMEDRAMTLTASVPSRKEPGKMLSIRMRIAPQDDGSVRQTSDISADGGQTWTPRYDYVYKRAL